MRHRFRELHASLATYREWKLLRYIQEHLARLPAGDRLIAGILGSLVVLAGLIGIHGLMRSVLVEIPVRGGEVIEGVLGSPRFINPLLALSDADRDLASLTFAGLMGIGPTGDLIPVLASSYSISEDGTIYTFVLREGIEFSDGTPITSEDVVFTVTKAQDPGLKSPEFANWANVLAEVVDARTVRFTLPNAYAPFLENTTLGVLPAYLWRKISNEEFPFSPLMERPVGAGPFKVSRVKRDNAGIVTEYELSAFNEYALGRPFIDSFRFKFFSQKTDLENALKNGSIQSTYGVISEEAVSAPYAQTFGVFFNPDQNALFANIEVRKALSVGINREHIVTEVLGGYATPLWGPVPPGSGIESTSVEETFLNETDRIARAAEILESGDWAYDEGRRVWSQEDKGLELAVTIKTSNVPELKAVAESVRNDWEKLGVPVSIELYEPGDLTQNVIRPRRYEALLFGMVVGREHDLFAFWHSSQRNDPGLNISLYANRAVDELLDSLRVTRGDTEAKEVLRQVNNLIALDYPAIFTHTPDFLYAAPQGVRGITLSQISEPSDRFAQAATWYRNTEAVWPFLVE